MQAITYFQSLTKTAARAPTLLATCLTVYRYCCLHNHFRMESISSMHFTFFTALETLRIYSVGNAVYIYDITQMPAYSLYKMILYTNYSSCSISPDVNQMTGRKPA
jgi:hypothetical protein